MKILLFSMLILLGVDEACKRDSLSITFQNQVVSIQRNSPELRVVGKLTNLSKTNLLFYAFQKSSILDSSVDSIFFNDIMATGGAGTVLIVLDKHSNRQEIHPEICVDCATDESYKARAPVTLSDIKENASEMYRKTSQVVKSGQTSFVTLTTSLNGVFLEKGEYKLYLVYYCGKELYDVVDAETVRKDEVRLGAKVFSGHIKSDTITLIVE